MGGVEPGERDDAGLTVEALAELQAGLLDDGTAARLRQKVRDDPAAQQTVQALNRVRRDVAALGADTASAPDVDPAVAARIGAALRDEPRSRARAAHTARPAGLPRAARVVVFAVGVAAVAVAGWVGTRALVTAPAPLRSRPTTAEHITVSRPPMMIPLSDQQILALLDRQPDFGPLADPHRRTSCLGGLGYRPDARVLGAEPVEIAARPSVLLLLPGDTPDAVKALAVAPTCSSVDTGLLADRVVSRP